MFTTLKYAAHEAHLDPIADVGLLIEPRLEDDIPAPGPVTSVPVLMGGRQVEEVLRDCQPLQAADWDHSLADLRRRGWALLHLPGEMPAIGHTSDGQEAHVLVFGDLAAARDLDRMTDALEEMCEAIGVIPTFDRD